MDRHELWLHMDNYKRKVFIRSEVKRRLLKSIKLNSNIPYTRRYYAAYHLSHLPRFSTSNSFVNRCVISSRVFGVKKITGYSRFVLRTEVFKSNIPGCRRASW